MVELLFELHREFLDKAEEKLKDELEQLRFHSQKMTENCHRFDKIEDRISDLEKENCELQVFKDFVEQLIRDTSDYMIDISVYVEELQKVFKNAAELCDDHSQKNHEDFMNKILRKNLNTEECADLSMKLLISMISSLISATKNPELVREKVFEDIKELTSEDDSED